MKIEMDKYEIKQAIQDFVFKKLGDTAYINKVEMLDRDLYPIEIKMVKVEVVE